MNDSPDSTDTIMEDLSNTIHLDSSGDLRLLVKDTHQQRKTLVVSSNAMCLASPVWRAMLDPKGHFREAKEREVEFPEDDLEALLIILRIAHLKFHQLPESVTFEGLVNLAVVCDKYDTVGVVCKWLPEWLAPWHEHGLFQAREEWLSIAWTNGDFDTFQRVTTSLVLDCNLDGTGRLCRSGKPLATSIVPNIIDRIFKAREDLITALLKFCSKLVHRYHAKTPVCRYVRSSQDTVEVGKECDTIVYGSLIRGLETIGILPSAVTSSDIHMSASEMMRQLQLIHCYTLRETQNARLKHSCCSFTRELEKEVVRIQKHVVPWEIDEAVDDSLRKHMEEQARK